ncbi:hypothetical protein EMIHUDRAFT_441534 [Emiliania huxleyi CCMP1516]|uniref:Uncharacterized protein n=2 Tax=Emiliania huxleyi TaxID=2903 RepID=A0A0D3KCV0_EMIH1|nr:hypothetical protein EMIHUDRAFT_441534 [Emiliania huxleyi CCMP1516]EOD33585.1 hypothetical protein EMIHUDRAFT_441534 [Emiliania huxleyi CCMP1516]|eukprot:XP_005786014.1 hypothetical protein EMIHUDRAFT_441534 [Emiliania huxleyi CCMP1516]
MRPILDYSHPSHLHVFMCTYMHHRQLAARPHRSRPRSARQCLQLVRHLLQLGLQLGPSPDLVLPRQDRRVHLPLRVILAHERRLVAFASCTSPIGVISGDLNIAVSRAPTMAGITCSAAARARRCFPASPVTMRRSARSATFSRFQAWDPRSLELQLVNYHAALGTAEARAPRRAARCRGSGRGSRAAQAGRRRAGARPPPLRLLPCAGRRPRRPLPSGDPTPRRPRARREWRRARDLCSRARRSQWHGLPGSKQRSRQQRATASAACSSSRRRSTRRDNSVPPFSPPPPPPLPPPSISRRVPLMARAPRSPAASPPPPPSRRRSARGRRLPCQSRRLPCQPAARTTAATGASRLAAARHRPPPRR